MRLTLLTATLSPAAGGLASSVPALAWGLDRLGGAEVHVVGTADPAAPAAASAWGPRVHAHPVAGPAAFRYAPGLAQTLRQIDPDLIDVQGLWTYPSLASLRHHRRTGRPYVVTPRGMLDPWARDRSRWKKALVRLWFEDHHLRRATCLRATAEMEAGHFRSLGLRQPIAIVPNSVETPPLEPWFRPTGQPRRLLFLSRIHPKKGLPFLLRAWQKVAARHPEWEVVIAGIDELDHQAEMQALAAALGLDRLHWVGPVHGAAKTALYRSADLFVLPTHAENFGLVIAEALAHGVPVITTRNAPWSGLHDHRCGWWIDLTDAALAEALGKAMTRPPAALQDMGARGHAWMERGFSPGSVADQMRVVYEWVCNGGPPPDMVHRE